MLHPAAIRWWTYALLSAVFVALFLGATLTRKTAIGGTRIIAGTAVIVWPRGWFCR